MEQLKRADSPFRFEIPEDLIPKLREIQTRQGNWRELIDAEDVVCLYPGLGPAIFLTFDGRVLQDNYDWDESGAYEVTDPKNAWSAVVLAADAWNLPDLLKLLPPRPLDARDCPDCRGMSFTSLSDAKDKRFKVVCFHGCGGLGWVRE
jgi:hypothetical protein